MTLHPIYGDRIPTREEAIQAAGAELARVLADMDAKSPRQVALESASVKAGTRTVDEIEDYVRAERGLPAKHGTVVKPVEPPTAPTAKKPRRVHRKKSTMAAPPAPEQPTRPLTYTPGGPIIAGKLAAYASLSPREAAEAFLRDEPAAPMSADDLEDIARQLRGLEPIEREPQRGWPAVVRATQAPLESPEPAPERSAPARRRRKPATVAVRPAEHVTEPVPRADPLAALAGLSKAQKRALAAALAAELGE